MSGTKESEDKKAELVNEAIKKLDTSGFTHHKLTVEESLKKLGASLENGLTEQAVKEMQGKVGLNELDKEEETTLWERIMEQFQD
jgi:magnesium-transporting ATPase (P-type)